MEAKPLRCNIMSHKKGMTLQSSVPTCPCAISRILFCCGVSFIFDSTERAANKWFEWFYYTSFKGIEVVLNATVELNGGGVNKVKGTRKRRPANY